jgi:hypothetical protein
MSFETWTPAPTPAKYSNGVGLNPLDLSNMNDTVDAAGNTILGAVSVLALLNKTPGFPSGATIQDQTNSNNATDGFPIELNGETRLDLTIVQEGGNTLNVGRLLNQMYGPNQINGGGVGNPGAFACDGAGSPTSPVWIGAPVQAVAAPVVPTLPPGYQWGTVAGFMVPVPISGPSTAATSASTALTPDEAAIIVRLGAWLTKVGG